MSLNRNIFFTFLTQIPIQLLGIISGVFIARMIGAEGKGVFAIYQANAQLLCTFFSLSLGNVLTYFIPSGKLKAEKLLGISLLVMLFSSVLIIVLTLLFYFTDLKIYLFPSNHSGFLYVLWIVLFSILSVITVITTGFLQGLKLFSLINKISVVNSGLNFLFFAILFIAEYYKIISVTVTTLLYALLILTFINVLQFLLPFIYKVKIKPDFNIRLENELKPIFNFTFFTHIGLFINFFNSRLSLWILNYYLNETAIGLFSLATNLIVIFNMISAPIGNVLMPFLSAENGEQKMEMFSKYSKINFMLLFGLSIFSFFIAIPIIPLIYGIEFSSSVLLFQILLPGILFSCVGRMFAVYIAASDKQLYSLYATLIGFFVNIIFNFYLIKYFGLLGAAIAGSLTYIFTSLSLMYYVYVKLKLPLGNYFFMSWKEIKTMLNMIKDR